MKGIRQNTDHHIIKKQSNKKEKNMKKKGTKIIVNFLIRGIIGFAIIFFVNEFLDGQGISACVGMNPITFLTSGSFGFPGVALLYGITFLSNYVNIAQRLKTFKKGIDKYKSSSI